MSFTFEALMSFELKRNPADGVTPEPMKEIAESH
jgi:hypothetical protein